MPTNDFEKFLSDLDAQVRSELANKPEVVDATSSFDVSTLPIEARRWIRIHDVVAVFGDLQNSSRLGSGKHAASTASIYKAAIGSMSKIFDRFDADFVQLQGDGGFALFWGNLRYERAVCAGITLRTFSRGIFEGHLERKWPDAPETGFKVGIASGRTLVKRVGIPRNLEMQEPVWSGNAVNFAAKASQSVDRDDLLVTRSVWDYISDNDYFTISCGCQNGEPGHNPSPLWTDFTIEKIQPDDPERDGRSLKSVWCTTCGESFVSAILSGHKKRPDVESARAEDLRQRKVAALNMKHIDSRNRRYGLALVR